MTDEAASEPESVEDELRYAPPHRGIRGSKGGCAIALVGAVVLGGGSIGLSYWLLQIRNRPVLEATQELSDIMKAAEKAPGTSVLADLGCDNSGVFELPALRTIAQRLEDSRAVKERRAPKPIDLGTEHSVVVCSMKRQQTPTCVEIGKKFAVAAKPSAVFTVSIVNLNGEVCAEDYAADGSRIGPARSPNLPPLDQPGMPD